MKYTISELSKILDVSTNTIRRYEKMGHISPQHDNSNHYRYYDPVEMEKIMYIHKFRKIGLEHEEIARIFQSDIETVKELFRQRLAKMDEIVAQYQALRHMVKDDINLMNRVGECGQQTIEMKSVPFFCALYLEKGRIRAGNTDREAVLQLLYQCPEIKYIYYFAQEDVAAQNLIYSEGIAVNQRFADKYQIQPKEAMFAYDSRESIMRIVRLPLHFQKGDNLPLAEVRKLLYQDFFDYMDAQGYVLDGDVIGIKISFSRERDVEWQYVLISYPVKK